MAASHSPTALTGGRTDGPSCFLAPDLVTPVLGAPSVHRGDVDKYMHVLRRQSGDVAYSVAA